MLNQERLKFWVQIEIPKWLSKYASYESFIKHFPSACASINFKIIAHAMALQKWNVKLTQKELLKIRY